jgi:hypothetical protein
MAEQTFIIKHWYGAETYSEAIKKQSLTDGSGNKVSEHDFNRVGVKRKETALKYLAGWRQQAIQKGWIRTFATLCRDDARYEIIATPDGYHETEVVASGWMKDLDEAA